MIGTSNVSAIQLPAVQLGRRTDLGGDLRPSRFAFGTEIEQVFGHLPVHIQLTAVVAVAVALLVGSGFGEGSDAAGLSKSFMCSEARWAGRAAHRSLGCDQKR